MLGAFFDEVEVERWDAPLLQLPSREAVRDYLVGKGVAPERARLAAETTDVPLTVTKRGALAVGRKTWAGRRRMPSRDVVSGVLPGAEIRRIFHAGGHVTFR